MTEHARAAGPGEDTRPAREQVVIKDKRKLDSGGKPKDSGAAMGQPGSATAGSKAAEDSEAGAAGRVAAGEGAGAAEPDQAKPGQVKPGEATTGDANPGDVVTGEVEAAPGAGGLGAELGALRSELEERVRDLQRVTAEYANYRKRVERDRGAVAEQVVATVVAGLLPILDDLDRAREHGDLVGPFGAVAEQLSAALAKFGLTVFGEPGDAFDPTRHEAVAHRTSAEVTQPTCVEVMRRGYLLGERLLRAAMVAVADPE